MKKEDEKLLNGLDMISGYISNEINLGKSKEEIVESLTNKMNISEEIAINLVYKNNNILKIMEYHKTSYTRKNFLLFTIFSFSIYYIFFLAFSLFNDYNIYAQASKYLGGVFAVAFILFGFTMNESKNIIYQYYCISITTILSLSSFLLGCIFINYIGWDETATLNNSQPIILRLIINIINFFITLGPQIIGYIFLVISFIFVIIGWKFYYEITIEKLKQ
ncbi:hypothetical protein [Aliarcobacter butzleri]|uniref:hypothetical protein n=1 Tax=Aliarcobacter butzleri TaxID=28197 RepID=UPI002B250007|nr:hypothetical protein [Aliarcobacter butzleri]